VFVVSVISIELSLLFWMEDMEGGRKRSCSVYQEGGSII
jgi:hypothetical protein